PTFGQPITFTATVAPVTPGSGVPTGTVTFTIDGTQIVSPIDGSGHATLVETLTPGSHTVTAAFNTGSGNFQGSTTAAGSGVFSVSSLEQVISAQVARVKGR